MRKAARAKTVGALLCLFSIISPRTAFAARELFSTATGRPVTLAELVEDLGSADIIIFGERHDDTDDHTAQRTLLQAMKDSGISLALGLEMFTSDAQKKLDSWVEGKLSDRDLMLLFGEQWSPDYFALYKPLLYYARQEGIRLVGLNIPRELPSKVGREGFGSLTRKERALVGELNCDIDDNYKRVLSMALGHTEGDSEKFGRFCEAQVLWDASMAANAVKFMKANPKAKLMILAGTYHAWKYGIPEQLSRISPFRTAVVLPSSDSTFVNYKIISDQADFIWKTQ